MTMRGKSGKRRSLRRFVAGLGRCGIVAACACAMLSGQENNFQNGVFLRDAKTKDLFAAARIAIFGGPGGIARLRSMRLKGRSRFPSTDGTLVSAAVEIRVLLPDRYLRIDSGSFGRRMTGYAGDKTLDLIEKADGTTVANAGDSGTIMHRDRAELARLMLGVATYASQEMPLKLQTRETPVDMPGPSEPLGIDAVGENGFAARIVFDGTSHLPVRLVYWGSGRTVLTTAYADRRSTGGMNAPYSIVTTAGDRIVDELLLDEIAVNPSLSKTDFSR
jgi:hypothetical protein